MSTEKKTQELQVQETLEQIKKLNVDVLADAVIHYMASPDFQERPDSIEVGKHLRRSYELLKTLKNSG